MRCVRLNGNRASVVCLLTCLRSYKKGNEQLLFTYALLLSKPVLAVLVGLVKSSDILKTFIHHKWQINK